MRTVYCAVVFTAVSVACVQGFAPSPKFQRTSVGHLSRPPQPVRVLGVPSQAQTTTTTTNKSPSLTTKLNMVASMDELMNTSTTVGMIDTEIESKTLMQTVESSDTNNKINEYANTGLLVGVAALVFWQLTSIDTSMTRGWNLDEIASQIPMAVWTSYSHVLSRHPIMTKAATSATVYTIGDIIAQRSTGTELGDLDHMRTLRSMLAGGIGHGPLSHFWYLFCDNLFENVLHWTQWWSFLPKVVLDQSTWGPIWNNSYILLLGIMQRESIETLWSDMKRTTVPLIVSGLKLWPFAHLVTYGLIPAEHRLLWVDMVEILWVTILATTAAEASQQHLAESPKPADDITIESPGLAAETQQ